MSGVDCDPSLRYAVFAVGVAFVGAVLAPALRGRPPSFGATHAVGVAAAYVAATAVVAARTLS